jgi:mannose-6-phosphate isomerase-like protein (cupin superfamily)/AraC-like DNA-binding protein
MSGIRSVSLDYGDTRFSVYLIRLPEKYRDPEPLSNCPPVMHSHFYYEIHYALRGQYRYHFTDRELTLQEGQMLLIPPETLHAAVEPASAHHELRVLSLSLAETEGAGRFYSAFLAMLEAAACTPMPAPAGLKDYVDVFQQQALYSCVLGVCRLKAAAANLVCDLFHLLSPFAPETPAVPDLSCDAEVAILLENMVNRPDISLEQIAAAINYSTRHTARLIKNIYGASLSEIRRSRKNN